MENKSLDKNLKKVDLRNAFIIGTISTLLYLACYFARNILSVVSPQIVENTKISVEYIGVISTTNMFFYAGGQLINGIIGDKIKAKYLVGGGIALAGLCNLGMGLTQEPILMLVAYSASGFFLSAIYAPLMKMIAENTRPIYAEKCCLGLCFAALMGAPVAGIVAFFFAWNEVFLVGGICLVAIGVGFYCIVHLMEQKGIVSYRMAQKKEKATGSFKVLIENEIIKYTFVSMLTGIVRTSVMFWIPTYLSQYLGFSPGVAATIFTVVTGVQSVSPYVTNVIIYEHLLKRRINTMILLMFGISTATFAGMYVVGNPYINIVFMLVAIVTANGASNVMWNVYCPSLYHTGMVSTATGYLDFVSYLAAGTANLLFANAIAQIGWGNLILVWTFLMGAGVFISLPWKKLN